MLKHNEVEYRSFIKFFKNENIPNIIIVFEDGVTVNLDSIDTSTLATNGINNGKINDDAILYAYSRKKNIRDGFKVTAENRKDVMQSLISPTDSYYGYNTKLSYKILEDLVNEICKKYDEQVLEIKRIQTQKDNVEKEYIPKHQRHVNLSQNLSAISQKEQNELNILTKELQQLQKQMQDLDNIIRLFKPFDINFRLPTPTIP